MISNAEIARIFQEMAALYEMRGVNFKPRAYEKAAMGVEESDRAMTDIYAREGIDGLEKVPGVGKALAEHIAELTKTGRLEKYERMKKQVPVDIAGLMRIPGIGPKTVESLYDYLGIRNVDDLKNAAQAGKIAELPGFGKESELKILKGVTFNATASGRYPLGAIFPIATELLKHLTDSGFFEKIEIGGSFRRRKETVGDLDFLGLAKDAPRAMQFFTKLPDVAEVLALGRTKSVIRLESGLQIDLRIVPKEAWGAAMQYFTGNKAHNIAMRNIAIKKGLKLSEYGVFKGKNRIAGKTEEDVYNILGLDLMPPELRTDTGEIEAAQKHQLPDIINYGDVLGDLQTQTNWTDGHDSIEEMAKAALKLGRKYIAITDHTRSLAMTGGNDEKRLLKQAKEIDRVNKKLPGITILKSAEVNILKDGSLDIADDALARLDLVAAAIHSHFSLSRAAQTRRIQKALSNRYVNIFFHPTTRVINRREPIAFDFQAVLETAKKNNVALEIDAHPWRLDLHDSLIRKAVEYGVKLVIDTDAHSTSELNYIHFGEAQARRGWAAKKDILNTLPLTDLKKHLKHVSI